MKQPTVTLTIPLEVFDRIFEVMGSRHKVDPDTEYILSTLYNTYINQKNPGDVPTAAGILVTSKEFQERLHQRAILTNENIIKATTTFLNEIKS